MKPVVILRPAIEEDIPLVLSFIQKLADYEALRHKCVATEEILRRHLFGPRPMAEVVLAYLDETPAGFALFFHNFSTFLGRPGIYLEDLFVEPEYRGRGIGKELLAYLAHVAQERGCGRIDWSVLDWNEPSIAFYKRLGAQPLSEWTTFRLTGEPLELLARKHQPADTSRYESHRKPPQQ